MVAKKLLEINGLKIMGKMGHYPPPKANNNAFLYISEVDFLLFLIYQCIVEIFLLQEGYI